MDFLIDNASTIIISLVLLAIVMLIARSMYKKVRSGKCISCDGCDSAGGCPGCRSED